MSIFNAEAVSDGQWHSLVVVRHGTVVTTFLDGHPQKASSSGTYTQLNDPHGLFYIGKLLFFIQIESINLDKVFLWMFW